MPSSSLPSLCGLFLGRIKVRARGRPREGRRERRTHTRSSILYLNLPWALQSFASILLLLFASGCLLSGGLYVDQFARNLHAISISLCIPVCFSVETARDFKIFPKRNSLFFLPSPPQCQITICVWLGDNPRGCLLHAALLDSSFVHSFYPFLSLPLCPSLSSFPILVSLSSYPSSALACPTVGPSVPEIAPGCKNI